MTESEGIFLIDSNILVYAYEEQLSPKKRIAEKLLERFFLGSESCAISQQNLAEFASAFLVKGKGNIESINKAISDITSHKNFIEINYSSETLLSALQIFKEKGIHFWDALIIATMKENGISNIYTENLSDFKIQGINAVNPFN